jgi:inosine-uridine nucleoside N-ribohydrolase
LIDRRQVLTGVGGAALAAASHSASAERPEAPGKVRRSTAFARNLGPRVRVMIVNDLSGDCDGLFATAHALLSSSAKVCGIVGTAAANPEETASRSSELANEMLQLMALTDKVPVYSGAERRLGDAKRPIDCEGVRAIVAEAMKDSPLPLYVTVGGGLTEIASALLLEPMIAKRLTLVWIGGAPHDKGGPEYNFNLDRIAAQFVFNESTVPVWQVTSKGYGTCHVSDTELQAHVAPYGEIGAWLYAKVTAGYAPFEKKGINCGETWALGDNPLVLLTALTGWIPSSQSAPMKYENTSSPFDVVFVPRLRDDGTYQARGEGRLMRVFNGIDTRLMFADFFAKMQMNYERISAPEMAR